jgi:FG-GAP-like repeat/FG-GAP repeat
MGSHPTSSYESAAKEVPAGLESALTRDLGITPAEFLADGAAATQAVKVVAALKARGVKVLGSSIHGRALTVNVVSDADVAAVKEVGAKAVIGAPKKFSPPKRPYHTKDQTFPAPPSNEGTDEILGGDPYVFNDSVGNGYECSVGFDGFSPTGLREFVTAGHCSTLISGSAYLAGGNGPNDNPSATNGSCFCDIIGAPVAGDEAFGAGSDYGVVTAPTSSSVGALADWGTNGTADSNPNTPTPGENQHALYVTGESAAETGANLCKSGATSGWTCGVILQVDSPQQVYDDNGNVSTINAIVATTCVLSGDSGGGAITGSAAIGMASASNFPDDDSDPDFPDYPCGNFGAGSDPNNWDYTSDFFPMVSAVNAPSVQGQLGSKWHIETAVQTPVVTNLAAYPAPPTAVTSTSSVSGTLANPTPTSKVSLYINSNIPWATVSAASGTWTIPLSGGLHTDPYGATLIAFDGFNTSGLGGAQFTLHSNCSGSPFYYDEIRTVGLDDVNCDGHPDVVARDAAGALWLYPGSGYFPIPGALANFGNDALGARIALSTNLQGMTAIEPVGDFNGDQYPDIVARDGAGTEWLYPGNGGGFGARTQLATGWGSMTAIQGVGDFNNDGFADLVARTAAGVVDLYPGTGTGLGAPIQLATGWQSMTAIVGLGDWNGDGYADLAARDTAGNLWLYPGTGSGLGARVSLGGGWQSYTIYPGGAFLYGGLDDLIARDSSGGLWLYQGNGAGGFQTRDTMGGGWSSYTIAGDSSTIPSILPALKSGGVGDLTADGNVDVVGRDSSGALWVYPGNGSNALSAKTQLIDASGSSATAAAIVPVGDFTGDGKPDFVELDQSGNLSLYPGTGASGFGSPTQIGAAADWAGMTAIQGVGDFDGDGWPDVVARDSDGELWLFPNNGSGTGFKTPVALASGWQGMTSIVGPGDWDHDGNVDLVARDSSGNLWLYPGNGSNGFGARTSLGAGWNGLSIAAVGDFNHDGYADLLAATSTGILYLYPQNPTGGFLARVTLGSAFAGYSFAGDGRTIGTAPINTVAPTVSGSAVPGSTWTVNPGTWTGKPAPTFAYYWLRCNQPILTSFTTVPSGCSVISSATSATYQTTAADAGKYLTAQVAGSNVLGFALAGAVGTTAIQLASPVNTGPPTVSGSSSLGSTWTVNTGTWTGTPAPTFGIYWLRCTHTVTATFTTVPTGCTAISGANGSTYVAVATDAGKYLTVQISGSNPSGFALAGAINSTQIEVAVAVNTAPPTVSGANTVGSTWAANTGTWTGTPAPTFGIYWLRCTHPVTTTFTTVPSGCTAISGANGSTYVAVAADAGEYLTVQVAGSNSSGFALAGATSMTAIQAAVPVNTLAPTVSGSNTVGSTWTAGTGTWTGTPAPTFAIYWLRCNQSVATVFTTVPAGCSAIAGANASTYVSVSADAGKYLTVQVAGSNSSGFALAGAINNTQIQAAVPVNTVAPSVSGANTVGSTWTANTGTWTGTPAPTFGIYWLRCTHSVAATFTTVPSGCTAISGANGLTYVAVAADAGKYLTVQVAGSNSSGFALAGAISTTAIQAAVPVNTVAPSVSGANTVGSTWTASTGTWTGTPAPTFGIYWLRCTHSVAATFTTVPAGCAAISGANSSTYVATAADVGKYLTVQVAGSNALGFALGGAVSTTAIQ